MMNFTDEELESLSDVSITDIANFDTLEQLKLPMVIIDGVTAKQIFSSGLKVHRLYLDSRYADGDYGKIDNIYKNAYRWNLVSYREEKGAAYSAKDISDVVAVRLENSIFQVNPNIVDQQLYKMTVLMHEIKTYAYNAKYRSYNFIGSIYDYNNFAYRIPSDFTVYTAPTERAKYIYRTENYNDGLVILSKPIKYLDTITLDVAFPYNVVSFPDVSSTYVLNNIDAIDLAYFYFVIEIFSMDI